MYGILVSFELCLFEASRFSFCALVFLVTVLVFAFAF